MAEDGSSLSDLLARIQFLLSQPVDFTRSDGEATTTKVRLLTAAATYFNILAVAGFGGRGGPARDDRLVEQVVAAAFQTFGDHDPHPGHFEKAAMLLRGITQGHPFNDGNKRTGFLLASYYLELVGIAFPREVPDEAVVSLCLRVSAGDIRDVETIASELRHIWASAD
jgi:prophage maintenance system killer protein